jgi:hypothetical protein
MNTLSWKRNAWVAMKNKTPPPPPPGNSASDGEWVAINFSVPKSGPAYAIQWLWFPMPDHTLVTVNGPNGATAPSMSLVSPVMISSFPTQWPLLTGKSGWQSNTNQSLSLKTSLALYPGGMKVDPPAPAIVINQTPKQSTGPSSTPGAPSINDALNAAGASNLIGAQWYSALPAFGRSGFPAGESLISLRSLPGQPVEVSTSVTQPPAGAVTAASAAASSSALVPAGPNLLLVGLGGLLLLGVGAWAVYELV